MPFNGQTWITRALRIALLLFTLQLSLALSWAVFLRVDFLYPLWYDVLKIGATIQEHAPQNLHRKGFEHTDRAEHIRLFADIVRSIRSEDEKLEAITYAASPNERPVKLLTKAEIVHLQDVRLLIVYWNSFSLVSLFAFSMIVAWMKKKKVEPLPFRLSLKYSALATGLMALLLILVGPETIFNALHRLVFPSNHVWFFPYKLSLMAILMKAPILFGPIGLSIFGIAAIVYVALIGVLSRLLVPPHVGG